MRISVGLAAVAALIMAALVLVAGQMLLQPPLPLITSAAITPARITPNADGDADVATITYTLARNAHVTIVFEAEDGTVYAFREDEPRMAMDYRVDFGGVVDGFVRPGETFAGEVLRRLMPNGDYTWRLTARDEATGEVDERSGMFTIAEADSQLPEISIFTVSPQRFTPNQDGIDDWTEINVYLEKPATLQVFLLDDQDRQIFIAARQEGRRPGDAGRHTFTYDGGISIGADPPPDGTYTVVALAQDDEGQLIRQTSQLTLVNGGKPLAEIVPQSVGVDVVFAVQPFEDRFFSTAEALGDPVDPPADVQDLSLTSLTVPLGDMLVFKLTVENYSDVPLRTSGPPPGTVYEQEQRAATLDAFDESGAWRVGIDCMTAETNYPWRWAIGSADDLVEEVNPNDGRTYRYLPPGARAVVWGAVRMTRIDARNPQNCWAGLIHEDVEISVRNNNVGTREIELVERGG